MHPPASLLVLSVLITSYSYALLSSASRIRNPKDKHHIPFQNNTKNDDDLSRNITSLLENLLKNYDSNHHPGYDSGQPTVVKSNILVRSMGPFSEHRMDYSMDCYFRQSWQDRRLSFNAPIETLSLSIKMLEGIWKPDTFFYNGKKSYLHTITTPNKLLRINRDGSILYSVRLTIKAKCSMDLRDYPMDHQSCPLVLGSYSYNEDELIYVWDETQGVKFLSDVELSQFDLISSPYRNASIQRGARNDRYSVLQVSFNLRRKQGYFLIQVYVPCALIVVLSWVSFWLNREATGDRVSLGITTVLTLSTLALDTRTDLPKVHYPTAMDWFIFITFSYCIAALIQFSAVHYFTKIGSGENYQTQEISVLHRKLMEIRGTPDVKSRDFADWERLAAELPEIYDQQHPGNSRPDSPESASSSNLEQTIPLEEMKLNIDADENCQDDAEPSNALNSRRAIIHLRDRRQHNSDPTCGKQMLYCLLSNQRFRQRRKKLALAKGNIINSVSQIDTVSRLVFPLSFIIINFIYWWGYVTADNIFTWSALDRYKFY